MDFIEKCREAVRIPTYWPPIPATLSSAKNGNAQAEETLQRFQEFLVKHFPVFHQTAERWVLNPYSVIYHLPGTAQSRPHTQAGSVNADEAVLFLAHYDVVPAETEKWSVDPFGAEMKDGFMYGRGTLDMKSMLISIMEAAENLCVQGWKPQRDIWFAFGGDEERTGIQGAMESVRWFAQRGQRFAWILDEGTPVAENQVKGINTPLALISIEEKGYLSLNLTVMQEPGHASRPPKIQAAAILGRALCRIAHKPFPCSLSPTIAEFFKQTATFSSGLQRFVMRHSRILSVLCGRLFYKVIARNPTIESMLRTTVAMTQLAGSAADNVLPSEVRAVINLRLLHPWSVETATAFIKKAINDERVQVSIHGLATDPVAPSVHYQHNGGSTTGKAATGWPEIRAAAEQVWPGIPVIPFIMTATTDSRHYQKIADSIFRFSPHKLSHAELSGVHGHDERISIENLSRGLKFYTRLMERL